MARDAHPYLSPDEKSSVKNPTIVLYLEETLFRHISSSGLDEIIRLYGDSLQIHRKLACLTKSGKGNIHAEGKKELAYTTGGEKCI